jgi:hypothetical protein
MTDALAITGMLESFKAIAQIGNALLKIRDADMIKAKLIELNGEILSAQTSALAANADQFALLKQVSELEKQVAELEAWDAEARKYVLYNLRAGLPMPTAMPGVQGEAFVYRLKTQGSSGEPIHFLCANCYQDRHKSILQNQELMPGACDAYLCHRCGNILYRTGNAYPEHFGFRPKRLR